jgi:aspartyl-tRNA(Asn)/glutamyl-tRNA(Gln) amidotransferase subunit C
MADEAAIGRDEVEAVAHLARLDLAEGEAEAFARDLGRILAAARALAALDLEGVDAFYRVGGGEEGEAGVWPGTAEARLRPDEAAPGLERAAALAAAPAQADGFFLVPTVVERT